MGIYDRDYYQEKGRGYLDVLIPESRVSKWLIGVHVGFLLLQLATTHAGEALSPVAEALSLNPELILQGQVWRLATYWLTMDPMLGWWSSIALLCFLWYCGSELEQIYGGKEFLLFYLASGFLGGCVGFASFWLVDKPEFPIQGPAANINALLFLTAYYYPSKQINLFFLFPIPVWLFAFFPISYEGYLVFSGLPRGIWVAMDVAGAVFAWGYFKNHWNLSSLIAWKRRTRERANLSLYVPPDAPEKETVRVAASAYAEMDEHFEAKVDAVLEKVAQHGQASLTDSEKQVLIKASEIYRRRRS